MQNQNSRGDIGFFHTVCLRVLQQWCGWSLKKPLQATTQSWGDLNLKAIWWVTCETWCKEGFLLSYFFCFFLLQLAPSKKALSFILLDLFIFLKYHVYFSIIFLLLFFFYITNLFYLNFSPINCYGDANESVTLCFKENNQYFWSCGKSRVLA